MIVDLMIAVKSAKLAKMLSPLIEMSIFTGCLIESNEITILVYEMITI